jgi:hypothetical protein
MHRYMSWQWFTKYDFYHGHFEPNTYRALNMSYRRYLVEQMLRILYQFHQIVVFTEGKTKA